MGIKIINQPTARASGRRSEQVLRNDQCQPKIQGRKVTGDHSNLRTEPVNHMVSQKQQKAICKNIFGEWTSQGKSYILWRKIVCHNGMHLFQMSMMHLFQMSMMHSKRSASKSQPSSKFLHINKLRFYGPQSRNLSTSRENRT